MQCRYLHFTDNAVTAGGVLRHLPVRRKQQVVLIRIQEWSLCSWFVPGTVFMKRSLAAFHAFESSFSAAPLIFELGRWVSRRTCSYYQRKLPSTGFPANLAFFSFRARPGLNFKALCPEQNCDRPGPLLFLGFLCVGGTTCTEPGSDWCVPGPFRSQF